MGSLLSSPGERLRGSSFDDVLSGEAQHRFAKPTPSGGPLAAPDSQVQPRPRHRRPNNSWNRYRRSSHSPELVAPTAGGESASLPTPDMPLRRNNRRYVPISVAALASIEEKAPDDAGAFLSRLNRAGDQYFATTGPP